jgi:cytoskeletal protein CcmA (bactofilin family)
MALQSPFYNNNKRDSEDKREPWRPGSSPNAAAAAGNSQPAATQTPSSTSQPQAAASQQQAKEGESKLTVGPNIKLKGVEITDCDTLVVEGTVEATMDSRVIQISERGAFKGSADIDVAEIRGQFDGNLTVRQKLVIYSTGKVTGRVRYGKVVIEEGGQLSGEIEYGTAQSRIPNTAPARGGLQQVHSSVG